MHNAYYNYLHFIKIVRVKFQFSFLIGCEIYWNSISRATPWNTATLLISINYFGSPCMWISRAPNKMFSIETTTIWFSWGQPVWSSTSLEFGVSNCGAPEVFGRRNLPVVIIYRGQSVSKMSVHRENVKFRVFRCFSGCVSSVVQRFRVSEAFRKRWLQLCGSVRTTSHLENVPLFYLKDLTQKVQMETVF